MMDNIKGEKAQKRLVNWRKEKWSVLYILQNSMDLDSENLKTEKNIESVWEELLIVIEK